MMDDESVLEGLNCEELDVIAMKKKHNGKKDSRVMRVIEQKRAEQFC